MKAVITQTMMTNNKWAIIEIFDKDRGGFGVYRISCPFDSKEEAIKRAELIAKERYGEKLHIVNETPEITELIQNY